MHRQSAESRANESRANESRANESRANESRAIESRANESRANESRANESKDNTFFVCIICSFFVSYIFCFSSFYWLLVWGWGQGSDSVLTLSHPCTAKSFLKIIIICDLLLFVYSRRSICILDWTFGSIKNTIIILVL